MLPVAWATYNQRRDVIRLKSFAKGDPCISSSFLHAVESLYLSVLVRRMRKTHAMMRFAQLH